VSKEDYAAQVKRLRVQWAGLLAGVSACRELQVLKLPYPLRIAMDPLFPPGAAFGRLTHLSISHHERKHPPRFWRGGHRPGGRIRAGRVAVGKLRRLEDLSLCLDYDGRTYHAFAQGLAASGGDRPLPLLRRVRINFLITDNADLVASLVLPSVREFESSYMGLSAREDRAALLLTACALRQKGYKYTWVVFARDTKDAARAIAQCALRDRE
jgi:hypothetical protein